MRTFKRISFVGVVAMLMLAVAPVHAIENVRGKSYQLTPKHGPWMIMVATFRNVHDQSQRSEGMSAEEAAAELVFELREKGIPAYAFSQDAVVETIDTRDRLGRDDRRIYAAQRDMICVLAGNYPGVDDNVAQKTLNYIKRFHPRFLGNPKSGAILRADASQRGPLAGAFLTINPLIKPEDVVQRHVDEETIFLNSNIQYPLWKNPHKYTVRVATFSGRSTTPIGNSSFRGRESMFDKEITTPSGASILRAGEDAEQLASYLRNRKNLPTARRAAEVDLYEAYVFHDKFQSIVAIGGFDTPNDPRIRVIVHAYGPELVPDVRLAKPGMSPEEYGRLPTVFTTHTEQLFAPNADPKKDLPLQVWTFDTSPQVITVPRIK